MFNPIAVIEQMLPTQLTLLSGTSSISRYWVSRVAIFCDLGSSLLCFQKYWLILKVTLWCQDSWGKKQISSVSLSKNTLSPVYRWRHWLGSALVWLKSTHNAWNKDCNVSHFEETEVSHLTFGPLPIFPLILYFIEQWMQGIIVVANGIRQLYPKTHSR